MKYETLGQIIDQAELTQTQPILKAVLDDYKAIYLNPTAKLYRELMREIEIEYRLRCLEE